MAPRRRYKRTASAPFPGPRSMPAREMTNDCKVMGMPSGVGTARGAKMQISAVTTPVMQMFCVLECFIISLFLLLFSIIIEDLYFPVNEDCL